MRTAADFDRLYAEPDPWRISRAGFRDRVLRRCVSRFVAGKTVLELGSGEGHLTQAIFSRAARVTGIDLSATAIARARSLGLGNAVFRQSDFLGIPFEGFDVIAAIECLYYLSGAEQLRFFDKVSREHRGKILILSAPIIGENQHRKYFTHHGIMQTLAQNGIEVIERHNLNIYRHAPGGPKILATAAAVLTRLPLTGWLLEAMPAELVYQRCYIATVN